MTAIEVNFDIYLGAAFSQDVTCYDDEEETELTDFTGATGQASVLDKFGDAGTELAAITVSFPSDGVVRFSMDKATVATLEAVGPGQYVWDALVWENSAEEEVWFRGVARVHPKGTARV